jgi:glycosyltransferase involved in cell wall biosynthesis
MVSLFPAALAGVDVIIGFVWILIFLLNLGELATYRRYRLTDSAPPTGNLVTVVVPARNEEHRIGPCLSSVLRQTQRNLQVLVVDDRSTDRTADVVREVLRGDARVSLVQGAEPPAGWKGKPWACHQGALGAKGDWMLFIDSDTILEEGAIAAALGRCRETSLEALSLVPRIDLEGFSAKVVAPVLSSMIRLVYPLRAVNKPESRTALVVGGFLMIQKTAYNKIGGHEAVRSELVEDKQIGTNLKAKRVPFGLLIGRELVTVGLFTGGQSVWDSVRRTVTNPLKYQRRTTTTFAAGALALFLLPTIALPIGILTGVATAVYVAVFFVSLLVPATVVAYDVHGVKGLPVLYSALALGGGTFIALAMLRQLFGGRGIGWRGRDY